MSINKSVNELMDLKNASTDKSDEIADLDKQIKEIQEKKQQLEEQEEKDLEKRLKGVKDLIAEMEEKDKVPSHERMADMYRLSKNDEAVDICIKATMRALEVFDTDELDISDRTQVKYIENIQDVVTAESEPGQPQVFIKPIQKEQKNWLGGHYKPPRFEQTDEVLVVVKINNGDGVDNQTVIQAVVKTETIDGKVKLKMGVEDPGIYRLESYRQFYDGCNTDEMNSDTRLRRGEVTSEDYLKQYKKENKESLDNYNKRRDQNLERNPEYTASKQEREEFIDSIPDRYTYLLEQAQELKADIIKKVDERRLAYIEKIKLMLKSPSMLKLMDDLIELVDQDRDAMASDGEPKNTTQIEGFKGAVRALMPSLTSIELEGLLG